MTPLAVVVRHSLRLLLGGRRLAMAILLAAVPVGLTGLYAWIRGHLPIRTLSPVAFYRDFVPAYFHTWAILASLLFASSAVADDEEDGTVVYLLTRPLRRGVVYLGKVVAASLATLLALLPSLLLTGLLITLAAGGRGGPKPALLLADLGWVTLAGIAYPAAFAAIAALGRRPLQLTVAFFFLWELPLAFAPTTLRYLTVSHYLLSIMPHTRLWNAAVASLQLNTPVAAAVAGILALTTVWLAAGSARYERREHVQTGAT